MTLVVCLRAKDCVVLAADSLTSISDRIESCTAVKVHKLCERAVVAGCGWAGLPKEKWSDVFEKFPARTNEGGTLASSNDVLSALTSALDSLVGQPERRQVGACRGGNTFLAATCDPESGKLVINKISREGDARKFEAPTEASPAAQVDYIEFIGDTTCLDDYIAKVRVEYENSSEMLQENAILFAQDVIMRAIPVAQEASVNTIGGSFVRVCVLTKENVFCADCDSGVKCAASAMLATPRVL